MKLPAQLYIRLTILMSEKANPFFQTLPIKRSLDGSRVLMVCRRPSMENAYVVKYSYSNGKYFDIPRG